MIALYNIREYFTSKVLEMLFFYINNCCKFTVTINVHQQKKIFIVDDEHNEILYLISSSFSKKFSPVFVHTLTVSCLLCCNL